MITPEKTEKEFDHFFKQLGYLRIKEEVGDNPRFANADYINKIEKIIVELKVLDQEHFPQGGIIDSLRAIIIKPEQIDFNGCGQYTFTLPNLNREGRHDNFEEPLRRSLKKANKQLKETKNCYFPDNTFSGFVFLAQTGMNLLSPEITAQLVRKILFYEFSSIDGAIICTPHFHAKNPVTQEINPVCVSVTKDAFPKLRSQCIALADKWIGFYENNGHSHI